MQLLAISGATFHKILAPAELQTVQQAIARAYPISTEEAQREWAEQQQEEQLFAARRRRLDAARQRGRRRPSAAEQGLRSAARNYGNPSPPSLVRKLLIVPDHARLIITCIFVMTSARMCAGVTLEDHSGALARTLCGAAATNRRRCYGCVAI